MQFRKYQIIVISRGNVPSPDYALCGVFQVKKDFSSAFLKRKVRSKTTKQLAYNYPEFVVEYLLASGYLTKLDVFEISLGEDVSEDLSFIEAGRDFS